MGRPRLSPTLRRSRMVGIRFTEEEYRLVCARAEGDTVSGWLRGLALAPPRDKAEPESAQEPFPLPEN